MSGLIEKVARVIDPLAWVNREDPAFALRRADSRAQALAALAAAAEWLDADGAAVYGVAAAKLRADAEAHR